MHTRYAPVRRSPARHRCRPLPLDLHVLSLPLAFILSQDQTLHGIYLPVPRAAPKTPGGLPPEAPARTRALFPVLGRRALEASAPARRPAASPLSSTNFPPGRRRLPPPASPDRAAKVRPFLVPAKLFRIFFSNKPQVAGNHADAQAPRPRHHPTPAKPRNPAPIYNKVSGTIRTGRPRRGKARGKTDRPGRRAGTASRRDPRTGRHAERPRGETRGRDGKRRTGRGRRPESRPDQTARAGKSGPEDGERMPGKKRAWKKRDRRINKGKTGQTSQAKADKPSRKALAPPRKRPAQIGWTGQTGRSRKRPRKTGQDAPADGSRNARRRIRRPAPPPRHQMEKGHRTTPYRSSSKSRTGTIILRENGNTCFFTWT